MGLFKSRAAREAEAIAKQERQEAERLERAEQLKQQKANETKELAALVNNRIRERRLSHESETSNTSTSSKSPSPREDEPTTTPSATGERRPARRNSNTLNPAQQRKATKEARMINEKVKALEAAYTERKRRSSDSADLEANARKAVFELDMIAPEEAYPVQRVATDPIPGGRRNSNTMTLAEKIAQKHGTAKERLADMQREADAQKHAAQADRPARGERSLSQGTRAAQIGTARAAASLAGGVFYTIEENRQNLEKMKGLSKKNAALEGEIVILKSELDALRVQMSMNSSAHGGRSFNNSGHGGRSFKRSSSPASSFLKRMSGSGSSPSSPSPPGSPAATGVRRRRSSFGNLFVDRSQADALESATGSSPDDRSVSPDSHILAKKVARQQRRASGTGASLMSGFTQLFSASSPSGQRPSDGSRHGRSPSLVRPPTKTVEVSDREQTET